MLWLPFLREVGPRWVDFFLSFTVGLLVFLGVDALAEALESSAKVAPAFGGTGLVLLGLVGTPLAIAAVGHRRRANGASRPAGEVALLVALAIGLHNLGEGLAIGGSYATGEIALGTFLVIGFLLHNTTEGLGIVAPLTRVDRRPGFATLAFLGAIAGFPTVIGAWIGGFASSPLLSTIFLAVGAGAIVQVVIELVRLFTRRSVAWPASPLNTAGLLLGLALMYATGVLVPA
jgi:zinc transporter ZupT